MSAEIAALVTSGVGALTVLGGGVAWIWNKIEKRFDEVEKKLAACERREARHQSTSATHLMVIELLWQEVKRRSRGASNDVLDRAGRLLDELKEKKHDKEDDDD